MSRWYCPQSCKKKERKGLRSYRPSKLLQCPPPIPPPGHKIGENIDYICFQPAWLREFTPFQPHRADEMMASREKRRTYIRYAEGGFPPEKERWGLCGGGPDTSSAEADSPSTALAAPLAPAQPPRARHTHAHSSTLPPHRARARAGWQCGRGRRGLWNGPGRDGCRPPHRSLEAGSEGRKMSSPAPGSACGRSRFGCCAAAAVCLGYWQSWS